MCRTGRSKRLKVIGLQKCTVLKSKSWRPKRQRLVNLKGGNLTLHFDPWPSTFVLDRPVWLKTVHFWINRPLSIDRSLWGRFTSVHFRPDSIGSHGSGHLKGHFWVAHRSKFDRFQFHWCFVSSNIVSTAHNCPIQRALRKDLLHVSVSLNNYF